MASRPIKRRNSLPIYAIVGDGYSEKIYFEQLREVEKIKNIQIKPDLPNRSGKGASFVRVMEKAEQLLEQGYDKVYCIIDFDTVIKEQKTGSFSANKARLEKKGIVVLICNPCFEIWYLLHFKKTGKLFSNCDSVADVLKQETDLTDYSKEQAYYNKKNLYKYLRLKLPTAFENAQFLEIDRDTQGLYFPKAEIFKIIQALVLKQKTRIFDNFKTPLSISMNLFFQHLPHSYYIISLSNFNEIKTFI